MSKNSPIIPEEIELFHIEILNSKIKEGKKPQKPSYDIDVAHKSAHNLKDERIRIKLLINLSDQQKKEDGNHLDFEADFHFKIQNLKNFYDLNEDNTPRFSGNLIATLLGISFSTARGMLYERLANTNFQGVILPVISPIKMLGTKRKGE